MYRYRKTSYRCSDCKLSFEKIRKFPISKYPEGTLLPFPTKDPECPQCKFNHRINFKSSVTDDTHKHINPANVQSQIIGGTPDAPSKSFSMGASNRSKAIDETAEIVMQDYGMTDINMGSNLRDGDNCVPKLRPELEQKVDQVFKPQPNKVMGMQGASQLNKALMNQINAGMYKNQGDVVRRNDESGVKIPTKILHEYRPPEKPN